MSPIIAGAPVKGPADRLMDPLGIEVSCVGVADAYAEFCGTLVIDSGDASRRGEVEARGVRAVVADTLMRDAPRRRRARAPHARRRGLMGSLAVVPLTGIREIAPGDSIGAAIVDACRGSGDSPPRR